MFKDYSKKRRLKYILLALACTATFTLTGLAAACKKGSEDKETDKTTSKEDTQLLKNGNFEFFNVPDDGVYLINTPANWTRGGSSSYTQSGIIGTSEKEWAALTDDGLAAKLDYNNALDKSDSDYKDNYVDYNGLKSSDLLYKDTYAALKTDDEDDGKNTDGADKQNTKEFIDNPYTHYCVREKDGALVYTDGEGKEQPVYEDADENSKTYGGYFFDEELKQPFSHVLMLHNYSTSHNGIAQNYSSVSVDLPANTAAEISIWVKTAYLKFSQGTDVSQDRGANITVKHTVGSSSLDDFAITGINTEKLIKSGKASADYNGWVEYTVYVNACDFAASTVTVELGLGESALRDVNYPVEGYAFFDDVSVTKYVSLDDCAGYAADKATIDNDKTSLTLSSDKSEKVFIADTYEANGKVIDQRYSNSFKYLIDLASEPNYVPVDLSAATAGLTVDDDGYVSSTEALGAGNLKGFTSAVTDADAKLPKNFASLSVTGDLLARVRTGYAFTSADTAYYERLNDALAGAADLPKVNSTADNMIVLLSLHRAAYTSSLTLTVGADSRTIVSFWVKTSDMSGSTAATVLLKDLKDEDNSAPISLDSTGITTDVGDDDAQKDIFDGWVQCFFFINNETEDARSLSLDFSFGPTVIKDTTVANYRAGWASLANMQTLEVDEDTFAYTGDGSYTASLTLTEKEETHNEYFDEVNGNQLHSIENDIANPSKYTGVNGASSYIVNNGHISPDFDGENTNDWAGLINKEYFDNYSDKAWFTELMTSFGATYNTANPEETWNEIFGAKSVQPLIIVNKSRDAYVIEKNADENTFKDLYIKKDDGSYDKVASDATFDSDETYYSKPQLMNYGFIGSEQTVSSDSFATASVRVKVSKGAVAYIYLVDTSASKNVLSFTAPSYTYYYDEDGNVLRDKADEKASLKEQTENILYTLHDDGLYVGADGKLRANVHNYEKAYKDSSAAYYDKNGNAVPFNKLVKGETYYKADGTEANCYLVTSDGTKIYEYKNGKYYYVMKDVTPVEVLPFETEYAIKGYSNISEDYAVKIEGTNENADKWITVSFVIHAGSENKSYRLELWSGERDSMVSGSADKSTVIFDHSYTNVSDDTLKTYYEQQITDAYKQLLTEKTDAVFASSTENISYYRQLVEKYLESGELTQADIDAYEILGKYTAHYYTYSLYDSANFKPFNKDIADANTSGYDYNINSYSETLAYLKITDGDVYTVFADYSAVDQSISLGDVNTDDNGNKNEGSKSNGTTVWLLVSSILLVVALIIAMLSILLRDMIKKARRNKALGKNNYNHQKAGRYIRKLHLRKEEFEEVEINRDGGEQPDAETVEEARHESVAEDEPVTEQPAEATPAQEPEESTESTDNDSPDGEQE